MKKIIGLAILSLLLSGCVTVSKTVGYGSSTMLGVELSTGSTEALAPASLTLGYKRHEALICPVGSTKVPSIMTNVNGQIGAGMGIETSGQQSLAIGTAADNLSKGTQ